MRAGKCDPKQTLDIARQLVEGDVGKKFKVILGGGRREFRDKSTYDEENNQGKRGDGKDLIDTWLKDHNQNGNASYVWNKQGLNAIDSSRTDYLLGLFDSDHCLYNFEIDEKKLTESKPRLSEMTEAAIKLLNKDTNGYFLFVEGAKIDMAHHETWARAALEDTKEFSNAVLKAVELTNSDETLIIVTADHAHTMTYNGYSVCNIYI